MTEYNWEKIESFQSKNEYDHFLVWLDGQIQQGFCEEFLLNNHDEYVQERLFKCIDSGEVWKLFVPDPGYYPGGWIPIYQSDVNR